MRIRGANGTKPQGAQCHIERWSQKQPQGEASARPVQPTVIGADGDWTIYNVAPGRWAVTVKADDFAYTQDANMKHLEVRGTDPILDARSGIRIPDPKWQPAKVRAGENVSLSFTLLCGATLTGRVLVNFEGEVSVPDLIAVTTSVPKPAVITHHEY